MSDRTITADISQTIGLEIISAKSLKGGSGDEVYAITTTDGRNLIYKKGDRASISTQISFYKTYVDLPYLPRLVFGSADGTELVITSLEQLKERESMEKDMIIGQLVANFISKYQVMDSGNQIFGFVSGHIQGETFAEFLISQSREAHTHIQHLLPDPELQKIEDKITTVYSTSSFTQKYLLHGDLGFHNFFYTSNQLTGIIDPDPVIGHPIYDLAFAFCSTTEQISLESWQSALQTLRKYYDFPLENGAAYLQIALLKRIANSHKHHPRDLEKYLAIWQGLA